MSGVNSPAIYMEQKNMSYESHTIVIYGLSAKNIMSQWDGDNDDDLVEIVANLVNMNVNDIYDIEIDYLDDDQYEITITIEQ